MQGDKRGARRSIWFASAALAIVVGLASAGYYLPTFTRGPALITPTSVVEGTGLYGTALDDNPPITVTALLDGVTPLEYSPDSSTEGSVNGFCFPVPVVGSGHFVLIEARNSEGFATQHVVEVLTGP